MEIVIKLIKKKLKQCVCFAVCVTMTKQAPPRFKSLSHFFEILSQPGYLSDFQDQWLIWKLIAKTTRLSNNITVLCKENIEEMAVEKGIFLADISGTSLVVADSVT